MAAAVVVLPFVPVIPMIFIADKSKISLNSFAATKVATPLFFASSIYFADNGVIKKAVSPSHSEELSQIYCSFRLEFFGSFSFNLLSLA